MLNIKSKTPNAKCFWNMVSNLQGRSRKQLGDLVEDGKYITTDTDKANAFAKGFQGKVKDLTDNQDQIKPVPNQAIRMQPFTYKEVSKGLKKAKSKNSCGADGIPIDIDIVYFDSSISYFHIVHEILLESEKGPVTCQRSWRTMIALFF